MIEFTHGRLSGHIARMAREIGEGERAEAMGLRAEEWAARKHARAAQLADAEARYGRQIARDMLQRQWREEDELAQERRGLADWKTRETELQKNREKLALLRTPPRKTTPRQWMDWFIGGAMLDLVQPGPDRQWLVTAATKYGKEPSDTLAEMLMPHVKVRLGRSATGELSPAQKRKIAEDAAAQKQVAAAEKAVFDREILSAKSLLDLAGDAHDRIKTRLAEGKTGALLGTMSQGELKTLVGDERRAWEDFRAAHKALRDLYQRGPGAAGEETPTRQPAAPETPTTAPSTQPAAPEAQRPVSVQAGDPDARVPTGAPGVPDRPADHTRVGGYGVWFEGGWEISQGDDVTSWVDTREGSATEDWDFWAYTDGRKFTLAPDGEEHEGWVYPTADEGEAAGGEIEIPDSMADLAQMIRARPGLAREIPASALSEEQRDELAAILAEMEVTP